MKIFVEKCGKIIRDNLKYVVLTLIFACVVSIAFVLMCRNLDQSAIVTVTSAIISIFGGALASVVVAWLIDIANQKAETKRNKKMINCVLVNYDIHVRSEMERCLSILAKQNSMDVNRAYSIPEIMQMLETLDDFNPVFQILCDSFSKKINQIESVSILFFEKSDLGVDLFRQIERMRGYANVYEALKERKDFDHFIKFWAIQTIDVANDIAQTRGISNEYKLSEKDIHIIEKYREAKKRNEAEVKVTN